MALGDVAFGSHGDIPRSGPHVRFALERDIDNSSAIEDEADG
jgi:hypothetical protein